MTLLLTKETILNQSVAPLLSKDKYRPLFDKYIISDLVITLVALEADGWFQNNVSPHFLAREIQARKFSKEGKRIELIVSDTAAEIGLVNYAHALVNKMASLGYSNLAVSTTAILVNPTIIIPPSMTNHNEWELFTISHELIKGLELNLNELRKLKQKKLIWHGPDIRAWLNRPQQICHATPTGLDALRST